MSINASGKGSSNMEADMDAAENARMNGTTDIRTENKPVTISPEPINKHIRRCDSLLLSKPTSKWEACGDLQTSALSLLGSGFVQLKGK
jgi:hypothetical protein